MPDAFAKLASQLSGAAGGGSSAAGGSDAAGGGGSSAAGGSGDEVGIQRLAAQLSSELDSILGGDAGGSKKKLAALRDRVLPLAEVSARVLQQRWSAPEPRAAARLELAQAAATRCCAYLRCAALGAGGGTAAGEGEGGKRCAGCGVAW